jgi:hypothetical protein
VPDYDDIIQATVAVRDPTTSAADLATITQAQPSLWADIAGHPKAYPALLDWLIQVGDDTVRQAVEARRDTAATQATTITPGLTQVVGLTTEPIPPTTGSTIASAWPAVTSQFPGFVPATAPTGYATSLIPPDASSMPSPGPQTPPGVTWARPDDSTGPHPAKKARKKTVLAVSIVAGVVALALVAWFLVRPALFPTGSGAGDYAPDLTTEPIMSAPTSLLSVMDQAWTQYYSVFLDDPASHGLGLAYIDVDYDKYSAYTGSGWYEGYDQDYDDGLAAGVACAAVPEPSATYSTLEWLMRKGMPAMYCSDYVDPPISDYKRYSSAQGGYADGFDDGLHGAEGVNRRSQPVALNETSKLVGFSLADGSLAWTYDLGDTGLTQARGADALWASSGLPNETPTRTAVANGSGRVALVVTGSEDTAAAARLVVLDAANGTVVSSTSVPVTSRVVGYVGSTVLAWSAPERGVELRAYADAGASQWTHASSLATIPDDMPFQVVADTWVSAGDSFVNLADGSPADFGADLSNGAQYVQTPDGSVWRSSDDNLFARQFTKWDVVTQEPSWTTPITVSSAAVMTPDASTLYDLSAGQLTAYRLRDGKQLWSASVDSGQVLAATADTVVLSGFGQGIEVFSTSGRRVVATVSDPLLLNQPRVYCGRTTIYVEEVSDYSSSFEAFDASGSGATALWSITAKSPGSSTHLIGDTFVVLTPEGEVSAFGS